MKKLLFIAVISLVFVAIIAFPVLADKTSPILSLVFTDDSDNQVDDETNILLNDFVATSQKLLDKTSPILAKLIDKSSPQLFRLDKASPQLMKAYDKASPKLMGYVEEWISLAKTIEGGTYTADIAGTEGTAACEITISSDGVITTIISTLNLDKDNTQTITMTYDISNDDGSIRLDAIMGGIGGILAYEWYLKFDGEK